MEVPATLLATLRGVHLLVLLLVLGTLVVLVAIAPADSRAGRRLIWLARAGAIAAILLGAAWLVAQAIVIGAPDSVARLEPVLRTVVASTRFGQVVTARLILILLALLLLRDARWYQALALVFVALAAALQGMLGHAGATGGTEGSMLVASEALHLIAAGAWLGALPALAILLATLPTERSVVACRRFSPLGLACVLVLMGTALAQAAALIGGVPALVGTAYGHIALLKLSLFLLLLCLALANRFVLTARLDQAGMARGWMLASLTVEATLGAGVILAASFLASAVPALHEQPDWPFPWRPSLAAMADSDLRREVVDALAMIGAALVAAAIGLAWRRLRWGGLPVAIVLLWFAVPHLGLLLVPAYPTSYYVSPTGFAAESIARGARLFPANCAACHGAEGRGDGPRAAALPVHPADLTALHLWDHADGELYWWLSEGIEGPEGGLAMPGFAATLSPDDRWALIDDIRAHNAGTIMAAVEVWPVPLRVPDMPLSCAGVAAEDITDLQGAVVRIITDAAPPVPVPPQDGVRVVVVRLSPHGIPAPLPGECVAATEAAWPSFAILAGTDPAGLAGYAFLVDPRGWLRAAWAPHQAGAPRTEAQLAAAARQVITHPIATEETATHAHHH